MEPNDKQNHVGDPNERESSEGDQRENGQSVMLLKREILGSRLGVVGYTEGAEEKRTIEGQCGQKDKATKQTTLPYNATHTTQQKCRVVSLELLSRRPKSSEEDRPGNHRRSIIGKGYSHLYQPPTPRKTPFFDFGKVTTCARPRPSVQLEGNGFVCGPVVMQPGGT
jgi:hypothetical protein